MVAQVENSYIIEKEGDKTRKYWSDGSNEDNNEKDHDYYSWRMPLSLWDYQ